MWAVKKIRNQSPKYYENDKFEKFLGIESTEIVYNNRYNDDYYRLIDWIIYESENARIDENPEFPQFLYDNTDDETLEMLDKFASTSISEANLEFKTLSVVFLPDELETATKVIDKARDASKSADKTWLAKNDEYDRWLDAQEAAMSSYGVSNVATAMDIILKVFAKNITQLQDGYKNDMSKTWVHLETVIGRRKIPSDLARKLSSILQKMESRGEIKKDELWKGLDKLCDTYLNGGE